jgi:hypothetical protein
VGNGKRRFQWYWLFEDVPLFCIMWMVMIALFCLLRSIRPPISPLFFVAVWLFAWVIFEILEFYAERSLIRLGSERVDPPKSFRFFWRGVLFLEAMVTFILLVLQSQRG